MVTSKFTMSMRPLDFDSDLNEPETAMKRSSSRQRTADAHDRPEAQPGVSQSSPGAVASGHVVLAQFVHVFEFIGDVKERWYGSALPSLMLSVERVGEGEVRLRESFGRRFHQTVGEEDRGC